MSRVLEPAAAQDDRPAKPGGDLLRRTLRAMRNMATLSQALRIVGAIVMLASMSLFLLQGWNEGNDIKRYLLLLSQTGLLTAGGLALSYGLRENRGARVFFGLALASVPANFTILGALIFSIVQWDASMAAYPAFASWKTVGATGTAVTLGGALLALVPLTLFCYTVMARRSARSLSLHFLALNALLLVPVRGSLAVGALVVAAVLYALRTARALRRQDRSLATPEGAFALALLFVPAAVASVRSLAFYDIDTLLVALLFGALFVGLRQTSIAAERGSHTAFALDLLCVPVAMVAALAASASMPASFGNALYAPVFGVVFALLGFDVARRAHNASFATVAGGFVSLLSGAAFIVNALEFGGLVAPLVAIVAGAAMLFAGRALRNGFIVFMAAITLIAGVLAGAGEAIEFIGEAGWIELAVFGAVAIAVGSVIERHGAALRLRFERWSERLGKT